MMRRFGARRRRLRTETPHHRRTCVRSSATTTLRWCRRTTGAPSAADRRAAHRAPRCTHSECAQDPNARRPIRQRAGPSVPPASDHSAPAPPTIDDRAEHTERLVRRATSASPSWASARCPRPTLNNSSSAGSSAAHHSALRPSIPSPRPACCRLRLALSSDTCQRSMTDRPALRYFRCRHELLAVGPAWGYDKATGRSQIVFLPTSPGMQNGSPGLHTATGTHPDHCVVARHRRWWSTSSARPPTPKPS